MHGIEDMPALDVFEPVFLFKLINALILAPQVVLLVDEQDATSDPKACADALGNSEGEDMLKASGVDLFFLGRIFVEACDGRARCFLHFFALKIPKDSLPSVELVYVAFHRCDFGSRKVGGKLVVIRVQLVLAD